MLSPNHPIYGPEYVQFVFFPGTKVDIVISAVLLGLGIHLTLVLKHPSE